LAVFADGGSNALYAGGLFDKSGTNTVQSLARWNGTAWSAVGSRPEGSYQINALLPWEDAMGNALLVAGGATSSFDTNRFNLARWNGIQYSDLNGQDRTDAVGAIQALAAFGTGTNRSLFVGGQSITPMDAGGSLNPRGVVRWDGQRWQPTEQAFDGDIEVIRAWDDGRGAVLFLGGRFTTGGGKRVTGLARWDGQQVTSIGNGIVSIPPASTVIGDMMPFNDGSGPALYVAGNFVTAGARSVTNIARWNGTEWSSVGGLTDAGPFGQPIIHALAIFNDGTGPALYAGGVFDRIRDASGIRFGRDLMKWDGKTWTLFPQIMAGAGSGSPGIKALLPIEFGPARGLYIGGLTGFTDANRRTSHLAVWDGQAFRSPGDFETVFPQVSNSVPPTSRGVEALAAVETSDGTEIFFGAVFPTPQSREEPGVARMRKGHWERLPALPNNSQFELVTLTASSINALLGFDDGFGSQLYIAALAQTPLTANALERHSWLRWTGTQWEFLAPASAQHITSNLLPYDLNGMPAILRSSTPFSLQGKGVVRWIRSTAPCP
jgi:hypothetical protein